MVCEEVSVYVSWLRTMIEFDFKETMINAASYNEMGLEAKENSCAKFLELREKDIQYVKPTRSASLRGVLCACDGESLADAAD